MAGNFLDDVDLAEYMCLLDDLGYNSFTSRRKLLSGGVSGDRTYATAASPTAPTRDQYHGAGDVMGGPGVSIAGGMEARPDAFGLARDMTRAGFCYMRLLATAGYSCVDGCAGRMWPVTHAMDKTQVRSEDEEVEDTRAEDEVKRRTAIGLWRRALANMATSLGYDIHMRRPHPDALTQQSLEEESPIEEDPPEGHEDSGRQKESPSRWWSSSKPWISKCPVSAEMRRAYVPPPEEGGPLQPAAEGIGGDAENPSSEQKRGPAKVLLGGLIQDVPVGFLPSKPFFRHGQVANPVPPPSALEPPADTPPLEPSESKISNSTSSTSSESSCSTWRKMARTAVDAPYALYSFSQRVSQRLRRRTASEGVLDEAGGGGVAEEGAHNDEDTPGGGCDGGAPEEDVHVAKDRKYIFRRRASEEQVRQSYHPWSLFLQRALSDFKVPNLFETVAATPRAAVAAVTAIGETLSLPEMTNSYCSRQEQLAASEARRTDSTSSLPGLLRAAQSALPGLVSFASYSSLSPSSSMTRSVHESRSHMPLLPEFIRGLGNGLSMDTLMPPALTTRMLYLTTDHFNPRDATVANLLLGREKSQRDGASSLLSRPFGAHRRPSAVAGEAAAAAAAGVGEPPSALSPTPTDGSLPNGPRPQRPMSCRYRPRAASAPRPCSGRCGKSGPPCE